jgi:phenylacetate-CoA ligase
MHPGASQAKDEDLMPLLANENGETLGRLRAQVAYAHERSPAFRSRVDATFGARGSWAVADFASMVPAVSKESLIAAQESDPPFGGMLCVDSRELGRIYHTAGSLYIGFTDGDIARAEGNLAREWARLGVGKSDVADITSTYHGAYAGTILDGSFRQAGATVIPGGPGNSDLRLKVMRDLGVTVLQAFTTYAETLAAQRLERESDRRTSLRLLIIGGELRTTDAKRRLSEAWDGAVVIENYGTAEVGVVALGCEVGAGMHLLDDAVIETRDPEAGGEIVATELWRRGQPFVRFRTGDITEGVDFRPCPCGRLSPRLGRILGRNSDLLRVRGVFVRPKIIFDALKDAGFAAPAQIVVDRPVTEDRLTIRLEGDASLTEARPAIASLVRATIGLSAAIEIVDCGALNGKPETADLRDLR